MPATKKTSKPAKKQTGKAAPKQPNKAAVKDKPSPAAEKLPAHWHFSRKEEKHYTGTVEKGERGKNCFAIKSLKGATKESYATIRQYAGVKDYLGGHLKMTARVKTKLSEGSVRLWLAVKGDWPEYSQINGSYDNMTDRPIVGTTTWKEYSLVVDVPKESESMEFGIMFWGEGEMQVAEFAFEKVSKKVELTGVKKAPRNLNFEDMTC